MKLFTYVAWDHLDDMRFQYYHCTLSRKIGDFNKGQYVNAIIIDFAKLTIDIYETLESDVAKFHFDIKLK